MNISLFKSPLVRDLVWTITSPIMLDPNYFEFNQQIVNYAFCQAAYQRLEPFLLKLDNDPISLENHVKQLHSTRLGLYFESLISFWLQHDPAITLLAEHIQVRNQYKTLGEYDYIFEYQDIIYHWEAAIKVYLHSGISDSWHEFIGPNDQDRLAYKLDKVFNRQLALFDLPEGKACFDYKNITPQAFIKGYLFYHKNNRVASPGIASSHLIGWWYYHDEFNAQDLAQADSSRFYHLPRLKWLSPWIADDDVEFYDTKSLDEFIKTPAAYLDSPAILIAQCQYIDQQWREVSRGFVKYRVSE